MVQSGAAGEEVATLSLRLLLLLLASAAPTEARGRNVMLIIVDDLRPEINAFGGGTLGPLIPGSVSPLMHTPHFDELAKSSLVLTKNYVQQAVCGPTRASILTGRRPDRTRTYDLFSYFRTVAANYTTIPEFFRLNGYTTVGMGKIFHPGHARCEFNTVEDP